MKFQWDEGNVEKSWSKHGVSVGEAESIWLDDDRKIVVSRIARGNELRFACIGISNANRLISVIFTFRNGNLIRPISARPSNKKKRNFTMDPKNRKVVSLPEYTGDLSKLFDLEHPLTAKEAFAMHKKHERILKKLSREFRKRYREEMAR